MSGCEFCEKWLDRYLDGDLAADEIRAFEEHIASSNSCRRRLEKEKQYLSLLAEPVPVGNISARVMERLGLSRRIPLWNFRRVLVPLAAGILILAGLFLFFRREPSPPAAKEPISALWHQAGETALTMRMDTRQWYRAGLNMFTGKFLLLKEHQTLPGKVAPSEDEFI